MASLVVIVESALASKRKENNNHVNRKRKRRPGYAQLVRESKMPAGGIEELQAIILKEMAAIDRKFECFRNGTFDGHQLSTLISVIISAMYIFDVQGRIGAITDLRLRDARTLFDDEVFLSEYFKTVDTYGYQAVLIPEKVKPFLEVYLVARTAVSLLCILI